MLYSEIKFDQTHGSPYDRGSADAYYRRHANPHKWPQGTGNGTKVELTDPNEIKAYMAGYNETTDRKEFR